MGAIKKMFNKIRGKKTRPGGEERMGSQYITGIAPGDAGSNRGGGGGGRNRRPGRRNADTPLGPGRQRM